MKPNLPMYAGMDGSPIQSCVSRWVRESSGLFPTISGVHECREEYDDYMAEVEKINDTKPGKLDW